MGAGCILLKKNPLFRGVSYRHVAPVGACAVCWHRNGRLIFSGGCGHGADVVEQYRGFEQSSEAVEILNLKF
jgi:hypothetical protein